MSALKPLPHQKLMDYLTKQPMGSEVHWCDYWRGFWDATRGLRRNPGIVLQWKACRREYANGYHIGNAAANACRYRRISKGGLP
jgi:hypothetical protein